MRDVPTAADGAPILVVDDDPNILQLVRMYLEREGFPVVTATDGIAAVAALRERARHEVRRGTGRIDLSESELNLLVALVSASGRIVTREALLDSLYGKGESEVLDRTIDVYIRRLRDKLGDDPESPRYIATVRGAGYRALLGR